MISLRSGINRHLTMPPFNRVINIMRNEAFMIANKTFSSILRKIKEARQSVKTHLKTQSLLMRLKRCTGNISFLIIKATLEYCNIKFTLNVAIIWDAEAMKISEN